MYKPFSQQTVWPCQQEKQRFNLGIWVDAWAHTRRALEFLNLSDIKPRFMFLASAKFSVFSVATFMRTQ